jgi:hypothetical protein
MDLKLERSKPQAVAISHGTAPSVQCLLPMNSAVVYGGLK